MPYCFLGSSIKFQGHTGWKIDDLNPIWVRLLGRSQLSNPSDLPCLIIPPASTKLIGGVYWYHLVRLSVCPSVCLSHLFTRGQFWPSGIVVACVCVCVCLSVCLYVCQSLACPRDNSGPVQARIAKFGPKMQKTLVKVPIVLGGGGQLTLTFKVKFNFKVRIHPILSLSGP